VLVFGRLTYLFTFYSVMETSFHISEQSDTTRNTEKQIALELLETFSKPELVTKKKKRTNFITRYNNESSYFITLWWGNKCKKTTTKQQHKFVYIKQTWQPLMVC